MITDKTISPIFTTPTKYEILNVVHHLHHLKENINNILKIKPIHYSISFKKLSKKTPHTITVNLIENHKESNVEIKLIFFAGNPKWWNKLFPLNEEIIILGKPKTFQNEISFVHPKKIENSTYFLQKEQTIITPHYKKTENKLPHSTIQKQILQKISEISEISSIIYSKIKKNSYINPKLNIKFALTEIHSPSSIANLMDAKKFLALLEFISYKNTLKQINHHTATPLNFEKNSMDMVSQIFQFPLTNGQKNAITKISKFQQSQEGKLFLLQGDVGCGKTIVAIISTLNTINSGFQTAIIAPTQILATQLYHNFNKILLHFDISCTLLISKENAKSKKEKLQSIKEGKVQVIIGTHAVFSNTVEFKNLGFTIIDEQHKFGVNQRLSLMQNHKMQNVF